MAKPMDLRSILENTARRVGAKTAIVYGERRVSFASLEEDSNRFAQALIKLGVKRGDRVAMLQNSSPEFVVVFFGIMKVGGIAVPLDTRYVADELVSLCNDCTPKVVVSETALLEPLLKALPKCPSIKHIITVGDNATEKFISYEKIMAENPPKPLKLTSSRMISPLFLIPADPPITRTASPYRTGVWLPRLSAPSRPSSRRKTMCLCFSPCRCTTSSG